MSNVVPIPNKRGWKYHAERIAAAWNKQIPSIIETGQCVFEAQAELGNESFRAMVQSHLPFQKTAAYALIKISQHPIISSVRHAGHLPASWATLEELTRLSDDALLAKLKDGSIHPKMERKDAKALRPNAKDKPKPVSREELIAAIQKDPLANQRDAAKALGVSLGMYQRTRHELIGSGEIKGPLTPDDLRERLVTVVLPLSKEERIKEVDRLISALDLNIRDWVSWFTLGKGK